MQRRFAGQGGAGREGAHQRVGLPRLAAVELVQRLGEGRAEGAKVDVVAGGAAVVVMVGRLDAGDGSYPMVQGVKVARRPGAPAAAVQRRLLLPAACAASAEARPGARPILHVKCRCLQRLIRVRKRCLCLLLVLHRRELPFPPPG